MGNDQRNSNNPEGENLQEYSNITRKLLQAEAEGNNALFAKILQQAAKNLVAAHPEAIGSIVRNIENLSIELGKFPLGDRAINIEIAIVGSQIVLSHHEPGSEKWAQAQRDMGIAYYHRIKGERAENIEKAIQCYTALDIYIREAFPGIWVKTQIKLAIAYWNRIRGERAENIEKAIQCYTAALDVYTREAFPGERAWTQEILGSAYLARIRGDKAENIEKAIQCYTEVLDFCTREAYPHWRATIQKHLATAYHSRIRGNKAENTEMALTYDTAAAQLYSDILPDDWG